MSVATFVYFVGPADGRLIKIGSTKMPQARLEQLMDWSPDKLAILASAPGNLYDEFALHGAFLSDLDHREWFRPSEKLLALIAAVKATGELPAAYRGKQPNWKTGQRGQKNPKPIKKRSQASLDKSANSIRERWRRIYAERAALTSQAS